MRTKVPVKSKLLKPLTSLRDVKGRQRWSTNRAPAARPGFTLLEVLVALSLLVALTGLAWPYLDQQMRAAELPESASRVQSLMYMTRSSAMLEHRRHRIRFEPGVQQPFIEYEPDPIRAPGEFFPVPAGWAKERVLLGDVQVHHIEPGRPIYLRPLGIDEDPATIQQEIEEEREAQLQAGRTDDETVDAFTDVASTDDVEIDENRPIIFFESDGSADWATIVLARIDPDDVLEEEELQTWVVLDGRTGLTTIRDQVTQQQLSDPDTYVQREKLEIPDTTSLDELALNAAPDDAQPPPGGDLSSGTGSEFGLGAEGPAGIGGNANPLPGGANPANPQSPGETDDPGETGDPGGDEADDAEQSEDDFLKDLEAQLADSDLTEEEKQQILDSFRNESDDDDTADSGN